MESKIGIIKSESLYELNFKYVPTKYIYTCVYHTTFKRSQLQHYRLYLYILVDLYISKYANFLYHLVIKPHVPYNQPPFFRL